jgi:hypothetical protein
VRGLVVASHQPDLLPYSGFFYKMAKADVFDLRIYDQFLKKGYQRRVTMRGQWGSIPTLSCPTDTPIRDVRIDPTAGPQALVDTIHGRYGGARYYRTRGQEIKERILDLHTDRLWEFNFELILAVRDMLGIKTPISVGPASEGKKGAGIVSFLQAYGAGVYVSGPGARAYLGDCQEFAEAGIAVRYSQHQPVTGDSILTVLMDYTDPLAVVLDEVDDEAVQA